MTLAWESSCGRVLGVLAGEHGNVLNTARLASRLALSRAELEACLLQLEREGRLLLLPRHAPDTGGPGKLYLLDEKVPGQRHRRRPPGLVWEGRVIAALLEASPSGTRGSYYRSADGAEVDLVLEFPRPAALWAIEIKLRASTRLRKSFHKARQALRPRRAFLVHSGTERFRVMAGVEAIGLPEMVALVKRRSRG